MKDVENLIYDKVLKKFPKGELEVNLYWEKICYFLKVLHNL